MFRTIALIAMLALNTLHAHAGSPMPQIYDTVPYSYGEIVSAFLKRFSCTNIQAHKKTMSPITLTATCNGRQASAYAQVVRIADKSMEDFYKGENSMKCDEQKVEKTPTGITVTQTCPLAFAAKNIDDPVPQWAQMGLTFTLTYN